MKFKILNQPETLDNEALNQIRGGGCGCQTCNHCNCKKNKGEQEISLA